MQGGRYSNEMAKGREGREREGSEERLGKTVRREKSRIYLKKNNYNFPGVAQVAR